MYVVDNVDIDNNVVVVVVVCVGVLVFTSFDSDNVVSVVVLCIHVMSLSVYVFAML